MPLIHVKSLPLQGSFNARSTLEILARDITHDTGIALEHITTTWDYLLPSHYAVGGKATELQPRDSHPLLVEILAPTTTSARKTKLLLESVAASLARHTGIPESNIFISFHEAHSGKVFDGGAVVRWESPGKRN